MANLVLGSSTGEGGRTGGIGSTLFGGGLGILGSIAELLLPPHINQPLFRNGTSAWGTSWPIVYNSMRVAGQLIQAGPVTGAYDKKKGTTAYTQTFAIGFCAGAKSFGRIWADNIVVYDPRPIVPPPTWQPNTFYAAGDPVLATAGPGPSSVQFIATVDGESGSTEPTWAYSEFSITRDGTEAWQAAPYVARTFVGKSANYGLTLYPGSETQLPDATLEEISGTGQQPGYRGLMYFVAIAWALKYYGERIPNIECETLENATPQPYGPDGEDGGVEFPPLNSDPRGTFGIFVNQNNGADGIFQVMKTALDAPTVEAYSASLDFNAIGLIKDIQCAIEYDGTRIWFAAISEAGVLTLSAFDQTTLALVDTVAAVNHPTANPADPMAISADNSILAGVQYVGFGSPETQNIYCIDTTTGEDSFVDCASIGGPASPGDSTICYQPVFDSAGFLWAYDNTGNFWKITVTRIGGVPTATAMVSINARPDDGAGFGPCDYNPLTDTVTAWSRKAGGGDGWSIPINATSGIVGTIYTVTDFDTSAFGVSAETVGWHTSPYVSLASAAGSGPQTVGIFNRTTGTTTFYGWEGTWSIPQPDNLSLGGATAVAQDGRDIVATANADESVGFDMWWFPFQSAMTLADICADVSKQVGLTSDQYDYTALESVIPKGAVIMERSPARGFLESIQPAFFYDLVDIGTKIVGSLRVDATFSVSIPETDLGAASDATKVVDRISTNRGMDLEIPKDFAISYYDALNDYRANSQPAKRSFVTTYSSGRNSLTVPVVMTAGEAANAAARMLYLLWLERDTLKMTVPIKYLGITPADCIIASRNGRNYFMRVTKATLDPATLIISLEGVSEDLGVYSLTASISTQDIAAGQGQQTIKPIGAPVLAIMDTATLRQGDLQTPGIYAAGAVSPVGTAYGGGEVVQNSSSEDGVYTNQTTLGDESVFGMAGDALPGWDRWTIIDNENTLTVTFLFGTPLSASLDDLVYSFANLLWMSNGEILQFLTATFVSGTTYQLTGLLRGRFGTETYIGTATGGETVVALDPVANGIVNYPASTINATLYWRGMNNSTMDDGLTSVQTLVMVTNRLRPYAPFFFKGSRDGSGNLFGTGLRRMRWRGTPLWTPAETDNPITMQVDILDGSTVVRTLTSTASANGSGIVDPSAFSFSYVAADQVIDFGSTQSSIAFNAYEMNALVGRGYPGSATL